MIRNIFNWVGGGFFRTIGRFVAFIVLGAVAYILIGKSNIKITDLLGIETVKAVTYTTEVKTISSSYFDINNASDFTCATWDSCQFEIFSSDSNPINSKTIQINQNYNTRDKDFIGYYIMVSQPVQILQTDSNTISICNKWTQSGTTYTCSQVSGVTDNDALLQDSILLGINFQFKVEYTDNNNAFCDLDGNEIICPTFHKQIARLIINWNFKTHYTTYALFRFNKVANNMLYNSPTGAIESQTQQQQQQHNETMNYITDTNMTETNSTATSFFDNFTDTDHGGLSSIITAPLSTINNMLSNTCVAPSATWKGATITLPCGDLLWSRPGADGLRNLLNVFYGGFICYYAIRRLFFLIENLKDPTKDNLEVTDL